MPFIIHYKAAWQEIKKEDARQVSDYARLKKIYEEFKDENKDGNRLIDAMIIYPDQDLLARYNYRLIT